MSPPAANAAVSSRGKSRCSGSPSDTAGTSCGAFFFSGVLDPSVCSTCEKASHLYALGGAQARPEFQ